MILQARGKSKDEDKGQDKSKGKGKGKDKSKGKKRKLEIESGTIKLIFMPTVLCLHFERILIHACFTLVSLV